MRAPPGLLRTAARADCVAAVTAQRQRSLATPWPPASSCHTRCRTPGWVSQTRSSSDLAAAAADAAGHACGSDGSVASHRRTAEAGRPLDATIGPGLQLMEQAYSVSGRVLRLVSPLDVDAVLDAYIAAGLDRDPYWCRAWPSAICLAQQLLRRPELIKGKRVADFGSGLGVAGLAAALAGAAEVVLLDREPMALSCGLLSAAATGIQGVTGWEQLQQQVQADMLGSGQQAAPAGVLQLAQLFATQQLQQQQSQQQQQLQQSKQQQQSQQQPSPAAAPAAAPSTQCSCIYRATPYDWTSSDVSHERFDVVLACDVLYEAEAVNDVARAIPQLMRAGSGSLLLLADPPNRTAANRQRFLEVLAAGGSSSTAAAAAGGGPPPSSSSSSSSSTQLRLLLQESALEECDVTQLDPEMLGGVNSESVAVQFMVFRAALGGETLGLKQAL